MGIIFGKSLKSVEEDVVSEVSEDVVSEDVVSEDVVSEDVVSEDVVSEVSEDVVSEDIVSEDVVSEVSEDIVSEDVVSEVSEDVVSEVPEVSEDIVSEDVVSEVSEDVVSEVPEVSEDVVSEVSEDVVSKTVKRKAIEDNENTQEKRRRLDFSCDDELLSTLGDTESRNTETLSQRKRKAVADDGPVEIKKKTLDPSAMFTLKYQQQKKLGEGGFGSVFAGFRKADNLPVAIKRIPRCNVVLIHEDKNGKQIPMEVAVMLKLAAESEWYSAPVDLIDWYDLDQELILVLERPLLAKNLFQYIRAKGGRLPEKEAKVITRQLLDAAIDLQQKKIFHRDIKSDNLLLETGMKAAPRVRVIDFGVSCFTEEGDSYDTFYGTYLPPEWFMHQEYKAGPSTVFQIALVLFDMLHKESFETLRKVNGRLSIDCKDFFKCGLHEDPDQRSTLEQLRDHRWMR